MADRIKLALLKVFYSFWLLPVLMAACGLILAFALVYLDETAFGRKMSESLPFLQIRVDGARSLVSTVAGGIVTMASLLFSLTFVALTLMSQQLGPRLIQILLRDSITKICLGFFIGAFLFALQVLAATGSGEKGEFIPYLSILASMGAAIGAFFIMIIFIHHMSRAIQADEVVANLAADLDTAIGKKLADRDEDQQANPSELDEAKASEFSQAITDRNPVPVPIGVTGYVEAIDVEGLLGNLVEQDLIGEVLCRCGHFVVEGQPVIRVAAQTGTFDPRDLHEGFDAFFSIVSTRVPVGEGEYEINALVEIAVRALSPGINDPFTALSCIDRLTAVLATMVRKGMRSRICLDDHGTPRLLLYDQGFRHFIDTAFHPIRNAGATTPLVMVRLARALQALTSLAEPDGEAIAAIRAHIAKVKEDVARRIPSPSDRRHLAEKLEKIPITF